jgi:CHASE3 domain sensor protein
MAKPLSSGLHDQSATVRQLKLLVVVLVLSNIGLGVFAFFLLRTIDRQYSDLIGRSVPILNNLQTLTTRSMQAMRGTNPTAFPANGADRAEFLRNSGISVAKDRDLRNEILRADWPDSTAERNEVRAAGDEFTRLANEVIAHYLAGRGAEAARIRESTLRAAFDRYVVAVTKAADVVEAESERMNGSVSDRAESLSRVLLGVATWPIIVLLGLLLLTAVFVVVLMVLFRGREMSEAP